MTEPAPRLIDRIYPFWALLALPAAYMLADDILGRGSDSYFRWTGLISCWLLILSMAVTPLMLWLGKQGWILWLKDRRRYIGVASFGYAALHLLFWLKHATVMSFIKSFLRIEVLPGWIAFFIMAAMAWTSTDGAVRRMGTGWKRLQRWVYAAAILTFLHWVLTSEHPWEPWVYSAPLIALSLWRMQRNRSRGTAA